MKAPTTIFLAPQARDSLRAAARTSRDRERGGILIGYTTAEALFVDDALLVPDDTAGRAHYTRRFEPADDLLANYIRGSTDPLIGYVGEWHTHPESAPPSATDRAAMQQMTHRNRGGVALVVAALGFDGVSVEFFGLINHQRPAPLRLLPGSRRVNVRYDDE